MVYTIRALRMRYARIAHCQVLWFIRAQGAAATSIRPEYSADTSLYFSNSGRKASPAKPSRWAGDTFWSRTV